MEIDLSNLIGERFLVDADKSIKHTGVMAGSFPTLAAFKGQLFINIILMFFGDLVCKLSPAVADEGVRPLCVWHSVFDLEPVFMGPVVKGQVFSNGFDDGGLATIRCVHYWSFCETS